MENLKKIGAVTGILAMLALSGATFADDKNAWFLCKLTGDPLTCLKAGIH